jgi:hypothetical protein
VLHYSLRKLQKDVDSDNGSLNNTHELDRALRFGTARPAAERVIRDNDEHSGHQHGSSSVGPVVQSSPFPRQGPNRHAGVSMASVDQQLQQDMFEPLDLAFQDSAASILPSNFNWLEADDSFQFDIESSAQARQAFHDLI